MARTPNSRKEETHERIVAAAARALRRHGYAGVGVADVMKEAGLTHGGFYAHFDSRDALIVEALERAGRESADAVNRVVEQRAADGVSAFRSLVETYLADRHLSSLDTGCPVAALGCDMISSCTSTTPKARRPAEPFPACMHHLFFRHLI